MGHHPRHLPTTTHAGDRYLLMGSGSTNTCSELVRAAAWIRNHAWSLADVWTETTRHHLRSPAVLPDKLAQFGEVPAFLGALAHAIERGMHRDAPDSACSDEDLRRAAAVHARQRQAAGFTQRDLLVEFVLLRDVLWDGLHNELGQLSAPTERSINHVLDALLVAATDQFLSELTTDLAMRADRDGLTGLLNRQAFHDRVSQELARAERHGRPLTLVTIDLDAFKAVNDTRGHLAGDAVLQRIGALLNAHTRDEDIVGRLGGDEFAVALLEADERAAHELVRRITIHMAPARRDFQLPPNFGLSYGTATFPADGSRLEDLLHAADAGLYSAKGPGRGLSPAVEYAGGAIPELGRLRVLIADDDPGIRQLGSSILERAGFDVDTADDGMATVAHALLHLPDVMLLDLYMPRADGWQVIQQLRHDARTKDIPVVMMTGADDEAVLDRAERAGIIDFVTKPFEPDRLISSVHRVLEWSATISAEPVSAQAHTVQL
jgi:diguanylate cyclase (GGDEF)-like protein